MRTQALPPKQNPKVTCKFEPRDIWIGIYWTVEAKSFYLAHPYFLKYLLIYICLVPCLPICIRLHIGYKPIPRGKPDFSNAFDEREDIEEDESMYE